MRVILKCEKSQIKLKKYSTLKNKLESVYSDIVKVNASTRDVAKAIKQSQYSSILFAMYRGKPYDKMIWRLV